MKSAVYRIGVLLLGAALFSVAGCVTARSFETGREHPSLEIVGSGVKFNGEYVMPKKVPGLLEECGVAHDTVIHIRISSFDRLDQAQVFRGLLARAGYVRTALVTQEHGESSNQPKQDAFEPDPDASRPRVRMRRADED